MIRACIYYMMLIMYTYMYNLIAYIFYFSESLFGHRFYKNITYYYAHAFFVILKIVGVRICLNNKIQNDRVLWISNHRSRLDGLIVMSLLRVNGNDIISIIKKSISYIPFFNSFSNHANCIFIKRIKSEAEKILTEKSKKSLETGKSILIFPEGTTMSLNSKIVSDNYSSENNLQRFNNVLIPKTTGYEIIQREGKFDKTGNITIRYADPILPGNSGHSFVDLFKIFPLTVYIDINYGENISPKNLYEIFSVKDKELNQPIIKDNYQLVNNYSKPCLILNFISFIIFYYLFFTIPFFRNITFIFNMCAWLIALFQ